MNNTYSSENNASFKARRFYFLISIIFISAMILICRVFDLAIFNQHFLRQEGDERAMRLVEFPAMRGKIFDRNGYPLAVSGQVFSLWVNPQTVNIDNNHAKRLAEKLQIEPKILMESIKRFRKNHKSFLYLKRNLSPDIAKAIKELHIEGLYLQEGFKRYYPEGEIASHVLGYTNVDDQGQEGVELAYDHWLKGEAGKKWVIKDCLGHIIDDVELVKPQKTGNDLVLSIDRRLQYLAYRALLIGISTNQAASGSAIILDAKSGEVLAMVNFPTYNPNHKPSIIDDRFRNRSVTDTFEPGSTVKAFSIVSALDSGLFKPDTIIDTSPGRMRIGRNIVDDDGKNFGKLSMAQILQVSSNVGITKLVLASPAYQLWDLLHRLGFGEITGIGFPGEQSGAIVNPTNLGAFNLATLSFGYGISVTALQLARAYLVFANDGNKLPVTLLKLNHSPLKKPVIEPHVAREVLELLETVILKGTGRLAYIPGYRVAGKTGTAKLAGIKGYQSKRYNSSFVGIAPLKNPRLIVAVWIHDPKGKEYQGGLVAGPVFKTIMEDALRILNIPPDE